ncbi:MAG: helix-turn-helix transcriptional regulator [Chitinivibrionales bacterium]|nr:helix-turn-helix transcriptional regulator [Chitinivibrionales bacterium]
MIAPEKEYLERIRVLMKRRRIALSLKQNEAAKRSGVNINTLRYFEQRGEISLENLLRLMNVYKMDTRLVHGIEDMSWWSINELENAEKKKKVR